MPSNNSQPDNGKSSGRRNSPQTPSPSPQGMTRNPLPDPAKESGPSLALRSMSVLLELPVCKEMPLAGIFLAPRAYLCRSLLKPRLNTVEFLWLNLLNSVKHRCLVKFPFIRRNLSNCFRTVWRAWISLPLLSKFQILMWVF